LEIITIIEFLPITILEFGLESSSMIISEINSCVKAVIFIIIIEFKFLIIKILMSVGDKIVYLG
jgi:hypothetical protein